MTIIMTVPDGPFYCDVCKKDSMFITETLQNGVYKHGALFRLSTLINGKEVILHPTTAFCNKCNQIKIFLETELVSSKTK